MPKIMFGNSWESFDKAPVAGMHALAGMGLSFIRMWVFWDTANPAPETYDWSKVDADIQAIRAAGMKVYADLLWAPPHAANNATTYLPYTRGCAAWNDPADGSKGIRFAKELPHCSTPAHIDAMAVRRFGEALATRHGDDISWYSAWNEPGQDLYWPAIRTQEWNVALARLLEEVTIPFTDGVRSVRPNAQFVGPEADHEAVIEEVLKQESDRDLHLFDVITFHPYSWGQFPADSYKRIDEGFFPKATEKRNGRPLWYSEIGDDGTGRIVEWTQSVASRDVAAINFHDYAQWFEPGTWANGTFVPNTKYHQMQGLIRRLRRRPRVIRSLADEPRLGILQETSEEAEANAKGVAALHGWRLNLLRGSEPRY